ncbi:E3 ubiquitin-protein ligase HUWE1 isoform X2 [Hydra vulgaris]|uniref:HECT-type E3 ubiquitin transferase n=1 Tax=Hydra vulgaris TaxID=6087 RepID=A0ABM4C5T5_HYDVU
MKIDRSKVKKGASEVPEDCAKVIHELKSCPDTKLLEALQRINIWYFGKCELYHWIDVLDRFDAILAVAARPVKDKQWIYEYDCFFETFGQAMGKEQQDLIFQILKFTALLIEHSYARHLYNSMEHLVSLLDCVDGNLILSVLNLIYVFSKRSNYLSRLSSEKKKILQIKLSNLAQTWGGVEAGCSLSQCCSEDIPSGAGHLYFEYYGDSTTDNSKRQCIDLKNVHNMSSSVGEIMEDIMLIHRLPENMQMIFYHRLRLAYSMAVKEKRLQFVQARLQAISILVYSNATSHVNFIVYDGLIEEIVNTLKLLDENKKLSDVKASCLKTLTAIIHLDRNPRLQAIIECTGATSYHGFLPSLVRQCILHMTNPDLEPFTQSLSTALFSFLYHLSSYESGCEALVSSGLIESLLKVVVWPGENEHITFVTRAVRVIDLITNLDMAAFQTHNGLDALVGRLQREVLLCSKHHGPSLSNELPSSTSDVTADFMQASLNTTVVASSSSDVEMKESFGQNLTKPSYSQQQCLPQRAALLKSILNFLKKAIPDPAFAEYTRTLMDENLQDSLKMIISNAEYYGALLFLLATDVVTVFIFHEPSLLSSLQDTGLTWVVLKALLLKDVPATRENLASLPNTLSALCLNTRGLNAFVSCAPFEKLFRILVIPEYLPAMKRRRSADPQGDTAMHLGSAMDELMRHQPTLKTDAMKAIIKLLKQLNLMGNDDSIIAFHPTEKSKPILKKQPKLSGGGILSRNNLEDNISDDEMEEEYLLAAKNESLENAELAMTHKKFVPVVDYLLNVTKFLDSILSNNGTDDHCVEFVKLGGLEPLFKLLSMTNFPLEFPLMPACQSVAQVCKSINLLAQDSRVFKEGLTQLNSQINELNSIYTQSESQGSALLHELASTEVPLEALYDYKKTPVVHAMSTTHAYVNVFIFICRGAQADIRNMSISQWGSDLGQCVLKKLTDLYAKLVWESGMLLVLCTPNNNSEEDLSFAAQDLNKLKEKQVDPAQSDCANTSNLTLLKWLLLSSSHLGRALAELFGLLVHQCVGAQGPRLRHTFSQPSQPSVPARMVTYQLTSSMVRCLKWECPININIPRLRLTYYVCCIGIWSVALFDSGKNPYHLMLQQLEKDGGLEALFDLFNWVVDEYLNDCDNLKKIVGLSEFLEGWLDLINRLVNTKSVLESNYGLPTTSSLPGFTPFDAANFLAKIHILAFKSVLLLWERKTYACSDNHSIADRIVSIMCHIISGEVILKETFALKVKPKDSKQKKSSTIDIQKTPTPSRIEQVSEGHLQQFVDMGFLQEHAREALITCHGNFQAATELLLTMPSGSSRLRAASSNVMEVDTSEEDMMLQAIAMSLGQEVELPSLDKKSQVSDSVTIEDKKISTDQLAEISKLIDNCTDRLLEGCMELLDTQPKAVHSVCKLLVVASRRNKNEWKSNMLVSISEDITTSAVYITTHIESMLKEIKAGNTEINQKLKELICGGTCTEKLTRRLHLFLLLSQNHENQAALTFQTWIYDILNLFKCTMETIKELNKSKFLSFIPGYLAPIILIFDHYERTSLVWKRKKMQICSHIWKWFDDRSGRWCNYSASNNASIDTAYHSGESTVRFTSGRRKYMVLFNTLVQINEETGNRRPIMLDVMLSPKIEDSESVVSIECGTKKIEKSKGAKRKADISDRKKTLKSKEDEITGLSEYQNEELLSNLVDLICIPIAPDVLNAAIRMLLRLTRVFKLAKIFANKGGIQHLLNLKETSSFPGAIPLMVLLLRHIVESVETMKHAVERAVVTACNNGIPNMFCGVGQNSLGARELHYLLRALGPIACRNTNLYIETTMKVAKLLLPSSRGRNQLEESIPPNSAQIVKVPQEIKSLGLDGTVESNPEMEHLVVKLLNSLIERHLLSLDNVSATPTINLLPTPEVKKVSSPQTLLVRRLRGENVDEDEIANVQPAPLLEIPALSNTETSTKPLLSEACIIRLLTELVKSYAAVAKLVVEFSYHHPDDGPPVPNNMVVNGPFLAFFFDYLLPPTVKDSDPIKATTKSSNISTLARALLSYVGTYWHNTDIESVFVDELKASYMRALMLPECKVKHLRLQALFNLVTLMVESAAPISFTSQPPVQNIGFVKILIKRGLIADLARCTHSLDLSSQDLVTTVNAMLKPLEKLTNLASNQIVQPAKSMLKEPKEETSTVLDASSVETTNVASQSLDVDVGNQTSTQSFYNNLEGVINEILTSNGTSDILGETLVTERSGDNGVEQEIVFETNVGDGTDLNDDSDSSLDQDGNNLDTMSEVSEGTDSDQHANMFVTLDDNVNNDSGDEDAPNNADRTSNNQIELEIQVGQDDIDDEIQFGNITENQGNDSQMEDDLDNDDDEDEDEENLNEDEENLNEDEADEEDTDEDVINVNSGASVGPFIFEEDDDEGGDTVEISFPQPAFTVHIPHLDEQNDTAIPALANRSSILIHPMLLDQPLEQNSRGPTNNETRNVNSRGNRGAGRVFTQRNTIHIHGNSNPDSIAQLFIGDDINQTNDGLSLEEDLFSQIEGSELTAGVLNSIPSSLARWTLESLLLDGSSVHDLVNYIKPSIVTHLEKLQLQELKEKVAEEKKKKEESEAEKATQLTTSIPSTRSRVVNEISEPMDVSPTSILSTLTTQQVTLAHPSLFTTPSESTLNNAQTAALVPDQITHVDTVLSSGLTTQMDTPSSFITPFNPLPDLVPNAPQRESLFSGLVPVSINSPNVNNQQHISSQQTPFDAPRLNRLRENDGALTGDLGFTPITQYLQQRDLPDAVQSTMPGESPCIRQVRSNLLFSQTPQTTVAEEPRRTEEGAILATELAAAIMLQLATTSPTPFSTANIQPTNVVSGSSISAVNSVDSNVTLASATNTEAYNEVEVSTTNEASAVSTSSLNTVPVAVGAEASINNAAAQIQRELENLGIPISVDPSFLAALPENIREEVLREQFGIRLSRPIASVSSGQVSVPEEPQEISPEFLAALPADMQREVLEQQRQEQARYNAAQQRPEQPVDPAEFVRNLDPSLRRQILADMDDTVLAVLPPELTSEAQGLRREIEQRQLRIHAERAITRNDLSQLLRHSGLTRRNSRGGFQFARLFPQNQMNAWQVSDSTSNNTKKVGTQLLDPESLTCLLVLLFLNDTAINSSRLHRILRNLSYHNLTKQWIINALISILRQTSSFSQESSNMSFEPLKNLESTSRDDATMTQNHQWLSRTLNLAFGGCVNIFQLQAVGKKPTDCFVTVHQQACLDVCKQTLEALSFLAKNFPSDFAPSHETKSTDLINESGPSKSFETERGSVTEFWDILVRLNLSSPNLKGKGPLKVLREFPKEQLSDSFVTSPLGQILSMLSHPVVKQSTLLSDKLLRLLAVISTSLPERHKQLQPEPPVIQESAHPPDDVIVTQPIHTVTFVEPSIVHHEPAFEDPDQHAAESSTVCSETASITSSLFVEPSENNFERISYPVESRHRTTGSVVSDGTVAQSDYSMLEQRADDECMDIDHQNAHSDTSSTENRSSPALSFVQITEKEPSILTGQLRMAVNVLASGSCSDEGLEDATTLLLQLSRTDSLTRDCILDLLLEGAQDTANILREEIASLLNELKEHNMQHCNSKSKMKTLKQNAPVVINPAAARSQPWRGRGAARLPNQPRRIGLLGAAQQRRNVQKPIIFELHLPTMALLTAKRSSQLLLLRILKVILQLRNAAKKSASKPKVSPIGSQRNRGIRLIERLQHGGSSLREVVAALEADMEAMYEMIDRFGSGNSGENLRTTVEPVIQPQESSSTSLTIADKESKKNEEINIPQFAKLSNLLNLGQLWDILGEALTELAETSDPNAVLVLQPAVEAFFLVHGSEKENKTTQNESNTNTQEIQSPLSPNANFSSATLDQSSSTSAVNLSPDTQKFLNFAETHRTVLNQILRQSSSSLADGPFAVLVHHTRLLDFDVKRRYFRQELEKENKGHRREDMAVHIRREHIFEDSYRELHRRTAEELKNRLYVVFDGEEGQDAGGLLREWYGIMAREMFNPNYALFTNSQGEKSTYLPNQHSHCNPNHLSYFKFAGRIVAKAIYDNKLLDCYFTRSFYKHILGKPVHYSDMEAEDYSFYQGLVYLLEHDIDDLGYELTFSAEVQVFGMNEIHDLKPNGRNIPVTEDTKREYVKLVCQEKMTGSIRQQIGSFLEGFYEIIPKRLISIFDEQELELLIAGLPTIDIEDLKMNTEYHKYTENSLQIQWLWRALRSFDQADRAKFLQFVTGTSKVPLQGFVSLEGMNGPQKFQIHRDDRSTDRLPCAHTCFNQLDLPAYETYDKLHSQMLKAINECPEGFGLA